MSPVFPTTPASLSQNISSAMCLSFSVLPNQGEPFPRNLSWTSGPFLQHPPLSLTSEPFAHCHLLGIPTRHTHATVWEAGLVTCSRSNTHRRLNEAEPQICLWATLPTYPKYMQITIIQWAESQKWVEVEGIPLPPPDLIFPVTHDTIKGVHLCLGKCFKCPLILS